MRATATRPAGSRRRVTAVADGRLTAAAAGAAPAALGRRSRELSRRWQARLARKVKHPRDWQPLRQGEGARKDIGRACLPLVDRHRQLAGAARPHHRRHPAAAAAPGRGDTESARRAAYRGQPAGRAAEAGRISRHPARSGRARLVRAVGDRARPGDLPSPARPDGGIHGRNRPDPVRGAGARPRAPAGRRRRRLPCRARPSVPASRSATRSSQRRSGPRCAPTRPAAVPDPAARSPRPPWCCSRLAGFPATAIAAIGLIQHDKAALLMVPVGYCAVLTWPTALRRGFRLTSAGRAVLAQWLGFRLALTGGRNRLTAASALLAGAGDRRDRIRRRAGRRARRAISAFAADENGGRGRLMAGPGGG